MLMTLHVVVLNCIGIGAKLLVIRGVPCGASDLLLQLFWSQATSPQPLFWHSHLKCLVDDCHLFKSFYNVQKSVAPVQSEFEFEKDPHFCCCQNWSNQFCKIQNNARFKNFKLMAFCALYLILKNPQSALFIGKWHCF